MSHSTAIDQFATLLSQAMVVVGEGPLDEDLERRLNEQLPPEGAAFRSIVDACQAAIASGWMCSRTAGGIRYGRVIKAGQQLGRFSLDVVEMKDVVGPEHAHPNGEIDMIMPLDDAAQFDGRGAGWLVYPAGSRHAPSVHRGRALVLYLLPEGAIDFGGAKAS